MKKMFMVLILFCILPIGCDALRFAPSESQKPKGLETGPETSSSRKRCSSRFQTEGKRVAILGAGGVSRSIIAALCLIEKRPELIRIYDMAKEKADQLVEDLKGKIDLSIVKSVQSIDDLNIEISDFLINATPVGMHEGDPCLVEAEMFHSNMSVYDVIYNPEETMLLREAKEQGAQVSNGLGMLFYQGVLAFQHWANIELDDAIKNKMRKSLEEGAKASWALM